MFSIEHIHLMFNHFPIVGSVLVALVLGYSLIVNDKHSFRIAVLLLVLVGATTRVTMWSGEEAEVLFNETTLSELIDEEAGGYLEEHEELSERAAVTAYAAALLGIIFAVLAVRKPQKQRTYAAVLLAFTLGTLALMGLTAVQGGRIHHPEFREGFVAEPLARPDVDSDSN